MDRAGAINALRATVDHVNGVITLLDEPEGSLEAIRRIQAVQDVLCQVASALLEEYLMARIISAAQTGDDYPDVLGDIGDLFCWANKLG